MNGMELENTVEYFTAPNGDHVSIMTTPEGTATAIVCHPVNNVLYFRRKYNSRAIAMREMVKDFGTLDCTTMVQTWRKVDRSRSAGV